MSYRNRISVLQESLNLLNKRIENLPKDGDTTLLSEAIQQRVTIESEIRRLRRLQWEADHNTVDFDE